MLEIEQPSWRKARYAVRDDRGHTGTWVRRRFQEGMEGDLDGDRYEMKRESRKQFVLLHSESAVAEAVAGRRGRWSVTAGDSSYDVRRRSGWRSEMELLAGEVVVGSIRKGKARRVKVLCELPSELSTEPRHSSGSWF